MSRAWKGGSTRGWRKLRARVLFRDGYRCRLQIPGVCVRLASCVHHTRGKAVTGDDPAYLIAACTPCNLATGDPAKQPDPPPRPRTRW